jgi:hypothetical protein
MKTQICAHTWCKGLDFAFEILVHQLGITIGTLNKPHLLRDHQPNTRMTQRTFAAVTGYAIAINNLCLRRLDGHGVGSLSYGFDLSAL